MANTCSHTHTQSTPQHERCGHNKCALSSSLRASNVCIWSANADRVHGSVDVPNINQPNALLSSCSGTERIANCIFAHVYISKNICSGVSQCCGRAGVNFRTFGYRTTTNACSVRMRMFMHTFCCALASQVMGLVLRSDEWEKRCSLNICLFVASEFEKPEFNVEVGRIMRR